MMNPQHKNHIKPPPSFFISRVGVDVLRTFMLVFHF